MLVVVAVTLTGCEPDLPPVVGAGSAPWRPDAPARLEAVGFTRPELSLAQGSTERTSLVARFSDGSERDVTDDAVFWSSDESVASIQNEPQRRGELLARQTGQVQIVGEYDRLTAAAAVRVAPPAPRRLVLSPPSAQVFQGQHTHFEVAVEFPDGSRTTLPSSPPFQASDATIARVEGARVTGLRPGSARLSVTWQGLAAEAVVQVLPPTVTRLRLEVPRTNLQRGDRVQLSALAVSSDGSTRDVTADTRWNSTRADAVQISAGGAAFGRLPGAAVVSGVWQGLSDTALLTVAGDPPTTLELLPLTPVVAVGATRQLFAVAGYADGSTEDFSQQVTWQSPDPSIASLSNAEAGLLVANAPGQVRLQVEFAGLSAATTITVVTGTCVALDLDAPASVQVGRSAPLTVTARFSSGQQVDVSAHATWTAASPSVGSVTNSAASRGLFVGHAPGQALLRVSWAGRSTSRVVAVVP